MSRTIPDALLEEACEALERVRDLGPNHGLSVLPATAADLLPRLRALPVAAQGEGWVLMPVEPTNKMLLRCQTKQAAAGYTPNDAEWLAEIYRAMVAAAPVCATCSGKQYVESYPDGPLSIPVRAPCPSCTRAAPPPSKEPGPGGEGGSKSPSFGRNAALAPAPLDGDDGDRLRYIALAIEAHAHKFPAPSHMLEHAEFLRELTRAALAARKGLDGATPLSAEAMREHLDGVLPNGTADGRDVQALHAAISRRSWSDTEIAANTIRDKLMRARIARALPTTETEAR